MQDGLIFKGDRVVIPVKLRKDITTRIHASHIGVEGCLRRAREAVYWPGMNAEVKDTISKCDTCNTYSTKQQKETLIPHDIPERPWSKVGSDIMEFDGQEYLITVDYYSNFWEIDNLPRAKSATVIQKLKAQFAHHGIPDTLVTDNGPQYDSEEFRSFARKWVSTILHHPHIMPRAMAKRNRL
jgi:transposase InsO family protein